MSLEEKENGGSTDSLRAQIKKFEKDFFSTNGRKPERADIKQDATIAAKYKAYQLATRPPPPAGTPQKRTRPSIPRDALHERSSHRVAGTPKKQTPSKSRRTNVQQTVLSPVQEAEPTPDHIRLQLGPTPQRDGQVLGIFDTIAGTPSRTDSAKSMPAELLVAGTPSKATTVDSAFSKTPQSSSKRFFLDAFAGTPLKRKREDDVATSSASKRKFATPSFLRRSFPLSSIEEDCDDVATAMPPPFRKRGLVRSLSSIIQGLRKQEEARMDDEWDVMNEIEQEQESGGAVKETATVLVKDSQTDDMPLGPDQAPESSEDEDDPGRGGDRPRKPWKKKGLKRQTRRVIMRPVKHKAGKEGDLARNEGSDAEAVPETQLAEGGPDSDEFEDASEDELADGLKKQKTDASKKTAQDDTSTSKAKPGGKKVNELAHANFRKLKIKNKNSKANGRGRKFGGRR